MVALPEPNACVALVNSCVPISHVIVWVSQRRTTCDNFCRDVSRNVPIVQPRNRHLLNNRQLILLSTGS